MKDLTKLTESQLRYELETIQSQMEQDEWPLAKQKKLRDEQDRIAAEIRRRWYGQSAS